MAFILTHREARFQAGGGTSPLETVRRGVPRTRHWDQPGLHRGSRQTECPTRHAKRKFTARHLSMGRQKLPRFETALAMYRALPQQTSRLMLHPAESGRVAEKGHMPFHNQMRPPTQATGTSISPRQTPQAYCLPLSIAAWRVSSPRFNPGRIGSYSTAIGPSSA